MPFAGYPYGFAAMEAETLSLSRGEQAPPDLKENFSAGPNATPPAGISADEALLYFLRISGRKNRRILNRRGNML
jgi:hypothetical protein